ncbi:3-oxoacyl-ACP synthase III [Micromonospora peucetia]|uniref:3-oxoacyl-[acyl-carrier-protein] synthase-3 n=1 Tax=Micromonospora peucetia TaxID=47871 RepID=A0A1C6W4Q1_9ACTN|nr:3-oxoacyl-ACP synthase III [Micromonospora peucetia]MCX4390054.1 3-oxoacyl-ACP synthase III [Micromonospora peucetia]SCL73502.1 3-oxoacyl-[acyl-carrier-protein] synthase-3 [Micromonospora peucetia]
MTHGNAEYRYTNTAILSVAALEAPVIVTSDQFDEQLSETFRRLRLRRGMLQRIAGIQERRWWPEGFGFADAAAMAGAKALSEAGVDARDVGLLINTSVSRAHLEPSTAVAIHHSLELPPSALNFDIANACLGFVNGIQVAANMIDAGQIRYALIVAGESSREAQQATIERLRSFDSTLDDVREQFATLTLGSGAAAMVLATADAHKQGHRLVGGVGRAATQHHDLCVGDNTRMRTDAKGLLDAGLDLAEATWAHAGSWDWQNMDLYVMHQVSVAHTHGVVNRLGLDTRKVPETFPLLGNVGPASLPLTLAHHAESLNSGDRVLCMGVGSGLNTCALEVVW